MGVSGRDRRREATTASRFGAASAVYYAAFKFFAMRKDTDSSAMYRTLFQDALDQYRETYGSKTTGGVINPGKYDVPNVSDVFKMSKLTEGM